MSRNPTLKRILRESAELASNPSSDLTASPLESDLYEWHFTLKGPPAPSPFENGIYHGRIILPPAYPLKPPSFRFLTPTGRFEVNREICLSISGHHEETWQPAWGIRTALVAIRSFMETDAKGQVGGMDASEEVRRRYAGQSRAWKCPTCQRTNEELMKEQEEAAKQSGTDATAEEVPEELRLAYREDLGKGDTQQSSAEVKANGDTKDTDAMKVPVASTPIPERQSASTISTTPTAGTNVGSNTATTTAPRPAPQAQQRQQAVAPPQQQPEAVAAWIDKAIYIIVGALAYLIWRKLS